MSAHAGLTFATLDPHDDTGRNGELLTGWGDAIARGFHDGRMNEGMRTFWLDSCRADRATLRGAWQERPAVGSGTLPVATFASFDKTLNVGGGRLLPLRMITDVTVSPTHRRRGLLKHLMSEDLADAVAEGLPVAALTVSEGGIYGRFGFGLASQVSRVLVRTDPRFALRALDDNGSLELAEPAEAWEAIHPVYEQHHARVRGSVGRPQFYEPILTARFDWEKRGPDEKMRVVVHLDATGSPDGYACYGHAGDVDGRSTLHVSDLVALTPAAYLRLWRFLADVDLVDQVRFNRAPIDDPLYWALLDPHVMATRRAADLLWVRVLDVPTALGARPWGRDGSVVVDVEDALGHAAGCWLVESAGGAASVSRVERAPAGVGTVRMSADTLGSLYLGGVGVATLAAAGRVTGPEQAVATWGSMADGGPTPYCNTGF